MRASHSTKAPKPVALDAASSIVRSFRLPIGKIIDKLSVEVVGDVIRKSRRVMIGLHIHDQGSRRIAMSGSAFISLFHSRIYSRMNSSSVAGPLTVPSSKIFDPARNAKAAIHIDPFIFRAAKATLDLLEVGDVVDLAKVRKALLRTHAKRVDIVEYVFSEDPSTSSILVPYQIESVSSNDTG